MRRTIRIVVLFAILLLVQFVLGVGGGVREARAALMATGGPHHVHAVASDHRAAREAKGRRPPSGSMQIDAPTTVPGGPHGCAGMAGRDCDRSGMPSGAPCCATHCTASSALGDVVSLSLERLPLAAPEWGPSLEPVSTNPAPDRPPPRV